MNPKAERNKEVDRLYREERKTVVELAERFHVTKERIRQILRKTSGWHKYRDMKGPDRPAFVAVNVTNETKAALKAKAVEDGTTMSKLMSDAIEEMVK